MSSPYKMNRRRRRSAGRGGAAATAAWREQDEEVDEQKLAEEEEEPRRRQGKASVKEDEDEEYYEHEVDENEAQQEQLRSRRLTSSRQATAGGGDAAGPSTKRRRSVPAAIEQESNGEAGPSQRRLAAAAQGGAARVTNAELRAVEELVAGYRRVRDHAAGKAEGKAPRMAMEQASRAVVRHMLFAHVEKPGVPVKRTEVFAVVTKRFPNLKAKGAVASYVIAHAQHYLAGSMGLEMRSMSKASLRGRQGGPGIADEGSQQYVLRSIVPPMLRTAFVLYPGQSAQRGLLMVVLSLVNLAGGKLDEDELVTQLGELGVNALQPHPVFGSVEALLKSFCTRRYIQQDKQAGPEGDVVLYRFAEQAVGPDAEIGEAAILKFIEDQFGVVADGGGGDGTQYSAL